MKKEFCSYCGKKLIHIEGISSYNPYTGNPNKRWENWQCPDYEGYYSHHYSESDFKEEELERKINRALMAGIVIFFIVVIWIIK
jgi:hypothetical protein